MKLTILADNRSFCYHTVIANPFAKSLYFQHQIVFRCFNIRI